MGKPRSHRRFRRQLDLRRARASLGAGWRAACSLILVALPLLLVCCAFPGGVRPTVKIGLMAPFEGRYRYVGYDVIYAVRLALYEANQDGAIPGYGVELVAYDDGADPAMAVEQARKLDVDPQVMGAMGHFREATTAAAQGAYAEAGLPLLVVTELHSQLEESTMLHTLAPSADRLAGPLLDRAARLASDAAVVLVSDGGPLGQALQRAARQRVLALTVVSPDADGWQGEALAQDPAVLLCDLDPVRAGEVVAALRERSWEGEVLGGPPLAMGDFLAVAGASAVGTTFVTPWPFPRDVAEGDAFTAAYREVSNGVAPGPLALPAYEGTWVLLAALERATADGAPTRERVSAALSGLEREGWPAPGGRFGRPEAIDETHGPADGVLFWYRVDAHGVPRLVERGASSGAVELAQRPALCPVGRWP